MVKSRLSYVQTNKANLTKQTVCKGWGSFELFDLYSKPSFKINLKNNMTNYEKSMMYPKQ